MSASALLVNRRDKRQQTAGATRHVDTIDGLWNLFDFTPEGRGTDWYPALSFD